MSALVLHPFDPAEAIRVSEAAVRAGKSDRTIRNWCMERQIGRRIAGQWAVSSVALDMFLAGDDVALDAYLSGDRTSERVAGYFKARAISVSAISDFAVAEAEHR